MKQCDKKSRKQAREKQIESWRGDTLRDATRTEKPITGFQGEIRVKGGSGHRRRYMKEKENSHSGKDKRKEGEDQGLL